MCVLKNFSIISYIFLVEAIAEREREKLFFIDFSWDYFN